jgi:hypothetical protein
MTNDLRRERTRPMERGRPGMHRVAAQGFAAAGQV